MNQLFYAPRIENGLATLDDEESRHLLTVLRRQVGDRLRLTDGKGFFYEAELAEAGKKTALVRILETIPDPGPATHLHVAIAPTKQIERFEWFLEKVTEVGIQEITPLLCHRSERSNLRLDRLEKILISAMKQSLHSRLPRLHPPVPFGTVVEKAAEAQRFIAWCPETPLPPLRECFQAGQSTLLLIGPAGDFTPEEAGQALTRGFRAVSLGSTRLRTETAGLVATVMLRF